MKTTTKTLFAVACAVTMIVTMSKTSAAVPLIYVCAEQMVWDMRHCEGQGVVEKFDATKGEILVVPARAAKSNAKGTGSTQGLALTCNQYAWFGYVSCIGVDGTPADDSKKKDAKSNNTVVPTNNNK